MRLHRLLLAVTCACAHPQAPWFADPDSAGHYHYNSGGASLGARALRGPLKPGSDTQSRLEFRAKKK